jgi:hypothetical protein
VATAGHGGSGGGGSLVVLSGPPGTNLSTEKSTTGGGGSLVALSAPPGTSLSTEKSTGGGGASLVMLFGPLGTCLSAAKLALLVSIGGRRAADAMDGSVVSGRRMSSGRSATAATFLSPAIALNLPFDCFLLWVWL